MVAATSRGGLEAEQGGSFPKVGPRFFHPLGAVAATNCLFAQEEAMITNTTVAGVAMLFVAVILAHPGPAMAQADVGKGKSPGASKGIIIIDGKPGGNAAKKGATKGATKLRGDAAKKGIIIVDSKPGGDAAKKGIIIIDSKPGSAGKLPAGKGMKIKR